VVGSRAISWLLLATIGFLILFQLMLTRQYHSPYPPFTASLTSSETELQDVAGLLLGLRRLAADIAWIQTLQYYGTPESGQSESQLENGQGKYPKLLDYCQRAIRIDPFFTYVYYYGAASLCWNLNRPDEAEILLKEGISANPKEARLSQYLAAMAYQKNHDVNNLITYLEAIAKDPESPLILKTILANIYKKQGLFDKAILMWQFIYETGTPDYQSRALYHIQELQQLIHTPKP
jgi:tetratricopeptide (TPR) repeat protein